MKRQRSVSVFQILNRNLMSVLFSWGHSEIQRLAITRFDQLIRYALVILTDLNYTFFRVGCPERLLTSSYF